jgi:galactokinase
MDQFASLHGRAGQAMLLDCRSLIMRYVPIPPNVTLVICNSMVRHSLASGEYNLRRSECEQCVRHFARFKAGIATLRDVSVADIDQYGKGLPDTLLRRARHVVSENERVLLAAEAMLAGDLRMFGSLMYDSHASLRDDYEVSCPELNLLVEIASKIPGVYGARMTGGGFGGCTISLVERDAAADVSSRIRGEYESATSIRPDVYITEAAEGAHAIT